MAKEVGFFIADLNQPAIADCVIFTLTLAVQLSALRGFENVIGSSGENSLLSTHREAISFLDAGISNLRFGGYHGFSLHPEQVPKVRSGLRALVEQQAQQVPWLPIDSQAEHPHRGN